MTGETRRWTWDPGAVEDLARLTGRSYSAEQLVEVAASARSVRNRAALWRLGRAYGECYLVVMGDREVVEVRGSHEGHMDARGARRRNPPHKYHKELAHRLQALGVYVDPSLVRDVGQQDPGAFRRAVTWAWQRGQTDEARAAPHDRCLRKFVHGMEEQPVKLPEAFATYTDKPPDG